MKLALSAFIFIFCLSCSEEEPLNDSTGCLTGVRKSTGQKEFIRCCSKQEFMAGSNVSAGGTSQWTYFTGHQWSAVKACSECK